MKKIEPGKPCIIKGSLFNDGRIVTPIAPVGNHSVYTPNGRETENLFHWEIEEKLIKKFPSTVLNIVHSHPARYEYHCPERNLFPLDNPGDDEEDTLSKIRKLEHQE